MVFFVGSLDIARIRPYYCLITRAAKSGPIPKELGMSNSTYKPKAGDRIRIVGNTCEHGFPIGSVVLVKGDRVYGDGGVNAVCLGGSDYWALNRRDFVPAKPKPALVKPKAPKPEPSLYKAIREHLETKDKETLHDRTKKAVEAVEHLLEGVQPAQENAMSTVPVTNIVNQATPTPWSLEGLVVDPGEEAVGQWGFFWDDEDESRVQVAKLDVLHRSAAMYKYQGTCGNWAHFAYIPDFPGAELLKCTTGYEAT